MLTLCERDFQMNPKRISLVLALVRGLEFHVYFLLCNTFYASSHSYEKLTFVHSIHLKLSSALISVLLRVFNDRAPFDEKKDFDSSIRIYGLLLLGGRSEGLRTTVSLDNQIIILKMLMMIMM